MGTRLGAILLMAGWALAAQTINTLVGTGYLFDGDGTTAVQAPLGLTMSMAVHPLTNEPHFIDTDNHMVMRVRADGVLFVVAGNGRPGFSGDGGSAKEASLNTPRQIAFDRQGVLYIADTSNYRVRRVDTNGVITTVGGTGGRGRAVDGALAVASPLEAPHGVAVDSRGNLYIADHFNDQIRRVDTNGRISLFAGTGATS
jgi:glucose/arabinose dehydrogenase